MSKKRKQYTSQFKFNLTLESIKNGNLSEISRKYSIGVNVLSKWKTQFIERGSQLFEIGPDQEKNLLKAKIAKLEQMLGKKEVELNVIKNFSDFYESQNLP